jgi:hypothetical protein
MRLARRQLLSFVLRLCGEWVGHAYIYSLVLVAEMFMTLAHTHTYIEKHDGPTAESAAILGEKSAEKFHTACLRLSIYRKITSII